MSIEGACAILLQWSYRASSAQTSAAASTSETPFQNAAGFRSSSGARVRSRKCVLG